MGDLTFTSTYLLLNFDKIWRFWRIILFPGLLGVVQASVKDVYQLLIDVSDRRQEFDLSEKISVTYGTCSDD